MDTSFYTYFHTRNDTGAVFYVGKGCDKRAHFAGNRNPHWHRIVAKCGHTVHKAMTQLTEKEAFDHEKFLISCFKDMGVQLTNCTEGGEGSSGNVFSDESKKKMSDSAMGKVISAETRARMSAAKKTRPQEEIDRCAAGHIGGKRSPETRLKMSSAKLGKTHSLETRAKLSAIVSAAMTPQRRAEIAASLRGRKNCPPSAEVAAKISATKMGHEVSSETRAKISATLKLRSQMAGV